MLSANMPFDLFEFLQRGYDKEKTKIRWHANSALGHNIRINLNSIVIGID